MKNFIGKLYAEKLHIRIDEGAGKESSLLFALLYCNPFLKIISC
jgi:hypothetical protein